MQNAETILAIYRERGKFGKPLEGISDANRDRRIKPLESRVPGNSQARFGGGCDTKLRRNLL
jgi:hypothetical protein